MCLLVILRSVIHLTERPFMSTEEYPLADKIPKNVRIGYIQNYVKLMDISSACTEVVEGSLPLFGL